MSNTTVDEKYEPIIGLEIHIELATESKMFCSCPADWFGKRPNSLTCPVCLGLPGALPVANKKAIEMTILLALSMNLKINKTFRFDRKHYFYPDLPKGYQISQYDQPIAQFGQYLIYDKFHKPHKKIGVTRIHLEEDTGKLIHKSNQTLVDFNRSGVPLLELVTEPDFNSSDEVKSFLEDLQVLVRYLGVSDADMEKGSMRLEPNISLRDVKSQMSNVKGIKLPKYKVEVKNINSFRFAKRAIDYEINRQAQILETGKMPVQETRGYNDKTGKTFSQRIKEEAADYRYFPEPDLPVIKIDDNYLKNLKQSIPELPDARFVRYVNKLGINVNDAWIITRNYKQSEKFQDMLDALASDKRFKAIDGLAARFASLVVNKKINLDDKPELMLENVSKLLIKKDSLDNAKLEEIINDIVSKNPKPVSDFKKGKENAVMFLVGMVMRQTRGQGDAKLIKKMIIEKIN